MQEDRSFIHSFIHLVSYVLIVFQLFSCGKKDTNPILPDFFYEKELITKNLNRDDINHLDKFNSKMGYLVSEVENIDDAYANNRTDQKAVDIIYHLLNIFDKICRENDIPYSIAYGTLLGAVRNGGVIPNDDDADVIIDNNDLQKIIDFLPLFKKENINLEVHSNNLVLRAINAPQGFDRVGLDVYPFIYDEKSKVFYHATPAARSAYPNDFIHAINFKDTLMDYSFGHLKLSGFKMTIAHEHLINNYKDNYYTEAYKIFDHVTGKGSNQKKIVRLKVFDYYHLKSSTLR